METAATCRTFQPQAPKIKIYPKKFPIFLQKTSYAPGWSLSSVKFLIPFIIQDGCCLSIK